MRKLHEILQALQDTENPSPRALRNALMDTIPYLVDARNKIVQLGGKGDLEPMGDALISTGIVADLSNATVNEPSTADVWREYASELELKLVDAGYTVHSIASDEERESPPTANEISEVENISSPNAADWTDFKQKLVAFFGKLNESTLEVLDEQTRSAFVDLQPGLKDFCGIEVSWPTPEQQGQQQ